MADDGKWKTGKCCLIAAAMAKAGGGDCIRGMQEQQIKGIPIHRRLSAYAINMHQCDDATPPFIRPPGRPLCRHYNLNGLWKKQLCEIKFCVRVSLNPALSCMHSACYPVARITPTRPKWVWSKPRRSCPRLHFSVHSM